MDVHINQEVRIPGYVVTEENIRRIEEIAREGLATDPDFELATRYTVRVDAGREMVSPSVVELLDRLGKDHLIPKTLSIWFCRSRKVRLFSSESVSIDFDGNGAARIYARGTGDDFEACCARLVRYVEACKEDYWWTARVAFLAPDVAGWRSVVVVTSICLACIVISSLAAAWARAGSPEPSVDVSESLIPTSRGEHYQRVEKALNSTSTNEKLDALLRGEFKDFRKVVPDDRPVIKKLIKWAIGFLVAVVLLILFFSWMATLYPLGTIAIGPGLARIERLRKTRDYVVWGMIIAFVVNVAAGVVLMIKL